MSRITRTTLVAVGALAVVTAPATAGAPVVGAQKTWTGAKAPVSVPGNHLHRGDRIPKGAVLVYREVTVSGGTAKRRVVLTLPRGKGLTGIAVSESSDVEIRVAKDQTRYSGKRRVTIVAAAHENHSGRITVYGYGH
ncbi:hypothetical protein AB0L40_20940 [Patulibacter sp. NPDC049589]|uniref:hypothetical protein n=1 Tax=Patulibacter sp. NPDC049589 TaxID=3154731 RepID=UPI00342DF136